MRNISIKFSSILMSGLFFCLPAQAEEKIDRQTETTVPRTKNLYGIGIGILPKTSGSKEYRVLPMPIINANYGERFYVNSLQAGVWLLDSEDKKLRLGLAAQARIGWDAEDGELTKGMDDRKFSVDVGPVLRWQTDYGTFNAQWGFDVGGASKGNTIDLQYIKSLVRTDKWRLNGTLGMGWNDQKFNDYYFGVSASEATNIRPAYKAGSGIELKVGLNGAYTLSPNSVFLFGTNVTRLGDKQADSPIVETRIQPVVYVGYSIAY